VVNKEIIYDLANETVRHYGAVVSDLTPKLAKRIQRKFKTKLDTNTISSLVRHYQRVYAFAASILKDCLLPPGGKYASPNDVDADKYLGRLVLEFPEEDRAILEMIGNWAIYYEYLR
jgi:hypothetical protein